MLQWQKWKKDLDVFQNLKSGFIIDGNINDLQVWINEEQQTCTMKTLNDFLYDYLKGIGYDIVVFYNKIDGFFNYREGNQDMENFINLAKPAKLGNCSVNGLGENGNGSTAVLNASAVMKTVLSNQNTTLAIIFDLVNVAISSPNMLTDIESDALTRLLLASKNVSEATSQTTGKKLKNCVYYITEKANDLPAWFYLNNPYIKAVTITKIDKELRKSIIKSQGQCFYDYSGLTDSEKETAIEKAGNLTEGFTTADLYFFIKTCYTNRFAIKQIKKAVDFYKYGQVESHWDKLDKELIKNFEIEIKKRVKGQDEAVKRACEIVCRASLGLTGIQKGAGTRPKGILFLAGPTGTGKTELAKSIAELIFGDESFITRFDMSEYQQPQSDQKLLGAPPGYVGYDAGGQLTNAVKEKPFNILLFDEIDKAHPSILDKFLQILDDGRMTDSFGETVYFSESLIIFTSNLGMTKASRDGGRTANVTIDMDYDEIKSKIMSSIKEFFTDIGRPEILNRIGSNIIVFDFIKEEQILKDIIGLQVNKVKSNLLSEKKVNIELSNEYLDILLSKVKENLENGARGIGNKVEEHLVNPLSYIFIEYNIRENDSICVLGLTDDNRLIVQVKKANRGDENDLS